jgi:hypothetical protein
VSAFLARRTVECFLDGKGFDVTVTASTDAAAVTWARGFLFHGQHEAGWYDVGRASFAVVQVEPLNGDHAGSHVR